MIKKRKNNKKGFTLIEIIVVLVIMGILLAIAVPSVLGYVNKAHNQQYLAQARNGFLGAQTIVTRESVTKPTADDKTNLNAAAINTEIGEKDLITAASCTVEKYKDARDKDVYKVTACDITVKEDGKRHVHFDANNTAEMLDDPATDATSTTY